MVTIGSKKEHFSVFNFLLRVVDILIIYLSGYVVFELYLGGTNFDHYQPPIFVVICISLIVFPLMGFYHSRRGISLLSDCRVISLVVVLVFMFLLPFSVVLKNSSEYSRGWFALWFAMCWILLLANHLCARIILRWMRSVGFNQRSIVVVGSSETTDKVVNQISNAPWAGLHIAGVFLANFESEATNCTEQHQSYQQLLNYLQNNEVDQIWIAVPISKGKYLDQMLYDLRHSTANIRYIPDMFGLHLLNHSVSVVAGLPILNLSVSPVEGVNRYSKSVLDISLGLCILVLIAPLMLIIALGVKLTSSGPVFYRQKRVSFNGRVFEILKFRSMPVNVENASGAIWAKKDENRATKFGSFLRKTSLDELPQFFNVLKGEMSIVGPRPERPELVEKFKDEIPSYMKKHLVKAGITGWAQVNGWRGDTCLQERINHDLFYIENWSLWFDVKIILLTIFKGFIHKNAY